MRNEGWKRMKRRVWDGNEGVCAVVCGVVCGVVCDTACGNVVCRME